jgi:AmmeMemoRadiSam system protein B
MDLRKMMLPAGWYPKAEEEAEQRLNTWGGKGPVIPRTVAGIVPHAGWSFSGETAWNIIRQIPRETELIILAGGHLQAGSPSLFLDYDALETPLGTLRVDREAASRLCRDFRADYGADNTVEIQLPLIKYHLPDVSILPVRLAPDTTSLSWSLAAAEAVKEKKTFFLGSTDLTHYGIRFAYTDYGFGSEARERIRKIDADFLEALRDNQEQAALEMAETYSCACSAGAAVAASAFAAAKGAVGKVIDQRYSYQVYDDGGDFVGYGSVLYYN